MLLGAATGEDVGIGGLGEHPHAGPLVGDGHPGDPLHPFRPPAGDHAPRFVEAGGAVTDVVPVDVAVGDRDVQQAQRERQIRAGRRLQVQGSELGRCAAAWVDHDQVGLGEVTDEGRHGLGHVRPGQQHHVGVVQVGHRERQSPIDAEPPQAGRSRRGHAEAAVVVDLRGGQRDTGELAEQVGLLVGQATAAEHRDRVRPVLGPQCREPARDEVQRLVPAHLAQFAADPQQRCGQPMAGTQQFACRPALLAQAAAVGREVQWRGDGPGHRHRALQRAVGAVGRDAGRDGGGRHGNGR